MNTRTPRPQPDRNPAATPVPQAAPTQARDLAASGALVVDVREPHEWAAGHIHGAVHRPLGGLDPDELPRDRPVLTICRSGGRSSSAARALAEAGHRDVVNLSGGLTAWARAGLPLVTPDGGMGRVA